MVGDPVAYVAYAGGLDAVAAAETLAEVVETCVSQEIPPEKAQIHLFFRQGGKRRLSVDEYTVPTQKRYVFMTPIGSVSNPPTGTIWQATVTGHGLFHRAYLVELLKAITLQTGISEWPSRKDVDIVGLHPNGDTQAVPTEWYMSSDTKRRWKTREELTRDAETA